MRGSVRCRSVFGARRRAVLALAILVFGLVSAAAPRASSYEKAAAHGTAVQPAAPPTSPGYAYNPVTPTRICDSRAASAYVAANQCNHNGASAGTLGSGSTISVTVAGQASVPPTATAAVLNITATGASAASYLSVWPSGQPKPNASVLNWASGQTVPNLVEVTLGSSGGPAGVDIFNATGAVDVIVDVEGYVDASASSLYFPLLPNRICDTRPAGTDVPANSCNAAGSSPLGPGDTRVVPIAGRWRVPTAGVTAAVLNVTATNTTTSSYLTAWPGGVRPTASNLNWTGGETLANRVIVPVAPNGTIEVFNQAGSADLIVDVVAYFSLTPGGSRYVALNPTRICDTRAAGGAIAPNQCNNQGTGVGTLGSPSAHQAVLVNGAMGGTTARVETVVMNVTVTNTSTPSYLTAFSGIPKTPTSDLNWAAGATRANMVNVALSFESDGQITRRDIVELYNHAGTADVVIDVQGYYAAPFTIYEGLNPSGITAGPDGALWFTSANDWIGRLTTDGSISRFSGFGIFNPSEIVQGADGALWFDECCNSRSTVGRLMPDGSISSYALPVWSSITGLTPGPDGAIWISSSGTTISRIASSGAITSYSGIGTCCGSFSHITSGPDGALWFTSTTPNAIGRITTAGSVSSFAGAGINSPLEITAGPDGALWFTNQGYGGPVSIGRITTDGVVTTYSDPGLGSPTSLVSGPDGALWFANGYTIGRIATNGAMSFFATPVAPGRIAFGSDGAVWFTDYLTRSIVRMTTGGVVTATYRSSPAVSFPNKAAAGSDGAMWLTNIGTAVIGRVASDGTINEYTDPALVSPAGITAGPDGALWLADHGGKVERMTTSGVVTAYAVGTSAESITVGPDSALWFTTATNVIGRITTAGAVTTYTDPSVGGGYGQIVAGPDGALWFTNPSKNSIGRITTAGVISSYSDPTIDGPTDITAGPDGALWFTNVDAGSVGRITTTGTVTKVAQFGTYGARQITVGSDGALWVTSGFFPSIKRITTSGVVTEYSDPLMGSFGDITSGPDGAIWFTNPDFPVVGRIAI